jgi:hypothetical protein
MDESTLRRWARQSLQNGTLPSHPPDRLWGGHGNGEACALCRARIPPEETAFELEFIGDTGVKANHSLHVRCFAAWELEREDVPVAAAEPLPAAHDVGTIAHRELDIGRKEGQP